jgi:hypothetical protein
METITQAIDLRRAISAENAAWLAQYPTDDAQIDYYTELAKQTFIKFRIDGSFTTAGIRKNVETWYRNKQRQMELFRKHPYWNEQNKAIVFLQDEHRAIDYGTAAYRLVDLLGYCKDQSGLSSIRANHVSAILYFTLDHFRRFDNQIATVDEQFIRYFKERAAREHAEIPKNVSNILKVGAKITRLARQCFVSYPKQGDTTHDATKLPDFDKYYAKFSDTLSELTIERITLASLHFNDFMLMSNGNSWSSCHYINSHDIFHEGGSSSYSGCYKQGCVSYALDVPSFILYTLPSTYAGNDFYDQAKLMRMCCQYENGVLVTGKCYPNNESSIITRYRQIMQHVISQCENVSNLWTFSKSIKKITTFVNTDEKASHYRDYEMEKQKPTISLCKGFEIDIDGQMTVGHESYCLHCGRALAAGDSRYLQCSDHRKSMICSKCGNFIENEDDRVYIGEECYCREHVFFCYAHLRYEVMTDDVVEVEACHGTERVCKDGMSQIHKCAECGKYTRETNIVGDGYVCESCIKNYVKCKSCGTYHKKRQECEICKRLKEVGVTLIKGGPYHVGDYVLMKHDVSCCEYSANSSMKRYYPDRIVKIRDKSRSDVVISSLDGHNWSWSDNVFVGVIRGVTDAHIGKKIQELGCKVKEETAHES